MNLLFNKYQIHERNKINKICWRLIAGVVLLLTAAIAPCKSVAAEQDKTTFTVVIDAGHGGHDHGAIDNGAREKDINLGVATKLAELIRKKMKNVKVVMTRDNDKFISLQERANIANRNKGDLFISIHTNSVDKNNPNRTKISGASVYALGNHKSSDNLRVARRENSVIELERDYHQKYSGFDPSKDESYIIFEMAQKKTIGQSLKFAEKAQRSLVNTGRSDRGVRQAGFWVLWATTMPSVLVELDFICNPLAAAYLNSQKGQEELAQALFRAFEQYVKAQNQMAANTHGYLPEDSRDADPRLQKNDFNAYEDSDNIVLASSNDQNVGTLVSTTTERKTRSHNTTPATGYRNSNAPRRRRSQAAREASATRNLETKEIAQKSETAYLLRADEPKEEVSKPSVDESNTKDKKGKKKKDKKKKDSKNKANKKDNKDKNANRGGQKKFVIKNSSTAESNFNTKATGNSGSLSTTASSAPLKRIYKILLATSDKELAKTDSRFQGIEPTGMFKENGLYKYTLGNSENRHEIEQQLLSIRSTIPDATIIVRME